MLVGHISLSSYFILAHLILCVQQAGEIDNLKQHKVVEEQLHLAATMWTSQMLKEPLQRAALDIALGARTAKSSV